MGILLGKQEHPHRTLFFQRQNNPEFKNNQVQTTKYTWYSFFPKAIILQFIRPANLVYLICAILQSIRVISSLNPFTAIAPFVFVIGISLIREGYEDYKRYAKDKQINDRKTRILVGKDFEQVTWKEIRVGDIIKVRNLQTIPADFLLLYTSEEHSLCFVETANLDGESNLKTKFAFTQSIEIPHQHFANLKGEIIVDKPNSSLHEFSGTVKMDNGPERSIDFDNFILRETILKNTQQVVGVVIYTGYDTKIIQNQGAIQNKVSHVQKKVNIIQAILLAILFLLSASVAIGFNLIHNVQHNRHSLVQYRPQVSNTSLQVLLIYFSSFLLLTFLIPISLNVSIEVIKGFLGIFLSFDEKMYYKPIDKGCNVNNVSILQELGQIDYVLTDKTGTLTANEMVFTNLSIGNKSLSSTDIIANINELHKQIDFHNFWLGLLICQDVVYDTKTKQYQGSSPDQVCFVTYARTIGYQFTKRTKNTLQFTIFGQEVVYELLGILPFDSRKRMSVIVRNRQTNKILIYTKGADSCILSNALTCENEEYLKFSIDRYAKQGYRTLLFSYREISNEEYKKLEDERAILKQLKASKLQTKQNIEKRENQLVENYESNLILLGATAIEDRLQDQVPETIARLQAAGIIVMMITGDKLQTAQNIGYLANFIKQNSKIYKFKAGIKPQEMNKLVKEIQMFTNKSIDNNPINVIIEGSAISTFINSNNQQYADMLKSVQSVIFCRSSPKQKASIVTFVKQRLGGITLAIGDGGNDVGMIQVANVGVGILGRQGNSASAASDFSIGQFKYLDRLVLHHGRWFYYRLSYFFVYYGWKNLIMTLLLYFFMIDSAFSAFVGLSQSFIAVYNVVIGLVLVVYFAVFEQDINDDQYKPVYDMLPIFYKQTKDQDLFSYKRYIIWSVFGIIISIFIYLSTRYGIGSSYAIDSQGHVGSYMHSSQSLALSLSIIIIMVLICDIKMYTWFSAFIVIGLITIIGTLLFFLIQNFVHLTKASNYRILQISTFRFWQVIFLNVAVVYAGKLMIETFNRQRGESQVQKALRAKKFGLDPNTSLKFIQVQQIHSISQI